MPAIKRALIIYFHPPSSFLHLPSYITNYTANEIIVAIGVLREAGDGVGQEEAQAAEGPTAIERIDGMAQDEGYTGR